MQESKSFPVNTRFEYSEREVLKEFCFTQNISISDHIRESSEWFRKTHKIKPKMEKYWDAFVALAESLP